MTSAEPTAPPPLQFVVDAEPVAVPDDGRTLLDVLREELGRTSVKDGCSPQGQCGCCTVLVDGQPRVSCVTPARRVVGREITTLDGLAPDARARWAAGLCATGGSQCGFCTPGIVVRLEGARARSGRLDRVTVDKALAAHLCRCTGWQTIVEAAVALEDLDERTMSAGGLEGRDVQAASRRAALEGRSAQRVGADVATGAGGFAADTAPPDALVAVPDGEGGWIVGETLQAARTSAGKVQGRRTTVRAAPPLAVPDGAWVRTLRTSWVEPAYLETDTSWCVPGGEPASVLANGGAFGAKLTSALPAVARRLADEHGRPVRVVLSREDTVREGPKRPPVAAGVRADGTGVLRVVRTPGIADAVRSVAPGLVVEEVEVVGPPTSVDVRGAGWVEAAVLLGSLDDGPGARIVSPDGAEATALVHDDGSIAVEVRCGEVLDGVVLRSYCIGAAHMALSWVGREGLAVDADGTVGDLTVRSFGIVRASEMPHVEVALVEDVRPAVNGSDAVFAAVAAAVWRSLGHPADWPVGALPGA